MPSERIIGLPPWSGSTFVRTLHDEVPPSLDPSKQRLPSPFVAVVTGASRGIGKAIALALARAGATGLLLTARTETDLASTKAACEAHAASQSIKVTTLSAAVEHGSSARAIAAAIRTQHAGRLDLLVNNAGIAFLGSSAFAAPCDIDSFEIEAGIQVNYLARFYMTKHLLPLMLADPSSARAIVNISSIGSQIAGPLGYSVAALATNRLSQRVAEAYADQGVFCCALHPGAVWHGESTHKYTDVGEEKLERFKSFSTVSKDLSGAFIVWLVKEKRMWPSGRYLDTTWDVDELQAKREEIVAGDKLKMRLVV